MIGQQAPPMHPKLPEAPGRSVALDGAGGSHGLLEVRMNAKPAVDGVVPGAYVETVTGEVSLWWDWGLR